jgi:hypothetical protein
MAKSHADVAESLQILNYVRCMNRLQGYTMEISKIFVFHRVAVYTSGAFSWERR